MSGWRHETVIIALQELGEAQGGQVGELPGDDLDPDGEA
jgi:hypothetical protein